jgi:hypothetical protein
LPGECRQKFTSSWSSSDPAGVTTTSLPTVRRERGRRGLRPDRSWSATHATIGGLFARARGVRSERRTAWLMSQKRLQFMELLGQDWSLSAAGRELRIGRSTDHIWKNGTVVRRKGGKVKIVPPLEPLSVRTTSPRFLSEQERIQIADLVSLGRGPTVMGTALGRSPSTISRELRRNLHASGQYRPFDAHAVAASSRHPRHPLKLGTDPVLRSFVIERWGSDGVRSRSAARFGWHPRTIPAAGWRPRRSIGRSTALARGSSASQLLHRLAPAVTIAGDTAARSVPAPVRPAHAVGP